MSITLRAARLVMIIGVLAGQARAESAKPAASPDVTVIDFSRGHWDRDAWTPARLANDSALPAPREFVQQADSIATTMKTFSGPDYSAERDNAILIHDVGGQDVQVELTFKIGKGFNGFSAPGLCLAPQVKDGVVVQSIAVFVADYAMAVWLQQTDGNAVTYHHLAQLALWSDPEKPHVLRCRVSQADASVAIQIDDADPLVLAFVGNTRLGFIPFKLNSSVGIWGCHGECEFQRMRVIKPGLLPFLVRTRPPQAWRQ